MTVKQLKRREQIKRILLKKFDEYFRILDTKSIHSDLLISITFGKNELAEMKTIKQWLEEIHLS